MTEYATSPSAIEEWNNARSRTADWVQKSALPGISPTPSTSTDSEWEKRSLWDGNGWDPPSDCESSTSVPPTMKLQYADNREVLITPHPDEGSLSPRRGRQAHSRHRGDRHRHGDTTRDEERTQRARSIRSADRASAPRSVQDTVGVHPSQTSSARLARAVAAPLPDSHSSSSGSGSRQSRSNNGSGFGRVHSTNRSLDEASLKANTTPSRSRSQLSPVREGPSVNGNGTPIPQQGARTVQKSERTHAPSHVPSHSPTYQASRPTTQHPSHISSHHTPLVPSHHQSHASSRQPSRHSHVPTHQSSHAPSHQPQLSHPPTAFSNHTATVTAGPTVNGVSGSANDVPTATNGAPVSLNGDASAAPVPSPPSINSIHSRSISVSDSRSSGPPEPIVVYPPSSQLSTGGHAISPSNSHSYTLPAGVYPHGVTMQGVSPSVNGAANVPLPPSSATSASLSYFSVPPRHSHVSMQDQQGRQSIAPSHHSQVQVQTHQQQMHSPNGQLPTPISPLSPSGHPYTSMPMRAGSTATMATTGLGGGYVLIDAPSPGHEKEIERELAEQKKTSSGRKSMKERGNLFNVFGGGKQSGHSRSKSLPMNEIGSGMEAHHEHEPGAYYQSPNYNPNPYLTPISPTSPQFPVDPLSGPHPPPIVYAPARHHRATHYFPPRIVYRQRHSPYDTQQILQAHTYDGSQPNQHSYLSPDAYHHYSSGLPLGTQAQYVAGTPRASYKPEKSPASVRRSQTMQETVRDSGWEEGKRGREVSRGSSVARVEHDHVRGVNVGDVIPRDYAFENGHPQSPLSPQTNGEVHTNRGTPASPSVSSVHTNLAGVGTVSARSRSRGRTQDDALGEIIENDDENERERSRSRSRSRVRSGLGMVYSASAPQPQGSVAPPHAAMMIPPPSTMKDRGVRETPYPTPPASISDQLHQQLQQRQQQHDGIAHSPNGFMSNGHVLAHDPELPPANSGEASLTPIGPISHLPDIDHYSPVSPHGADGNSTLMDPSRGRTRERSKKDGRRFGLRRDLQLRSVNENGNKNGRAQSVDSQASCSSSSTYYVLTSPGQKVRVVRTDGAAATESTVASHHPSSGGWLKKALRPRFLHRDAAQERHSPATGRRNRDHSHSPAQALAPSLDPARTPSGGSGKSGKSGKKGGRKLVRRTSTGSAALLNSVGSHASQRAAPAAEEYRDVDIVIPGK